MKQKVPWESEKRRMLDSNKASPDILFYNQPRNQSIHADSVHNSWKKYFWIISILKWMHAAYEKFWSTAHSRISDLVENCASPIKISI